MIHHIAAHRVPGKTQWGIDTDRHDLWPGQVETADDNHRMKLVEIQHNRSSEMNLFDEIAITNRGYCAQLGLPTDVYDRALSESEIGGRLSADEQHIAEMIVSESPKLHNIRMKKLHVQTERSCRIRRMKYAPSCQPFNGFESMCYREKIIRGLGD